MYKQIYKQIKKYDNIVIVRHVGVDPDAMASQIALRDSIKLTFPNKNVFAIGNGTVRFNFIGKLDKGIDFKTLDNILLIALDTPDVKRVDMGDLEKYDYSIKIDHHPFVNKFCDIEMINDKKSSASEMVYDLIENTKLEINEQITKTIFCGIVSDTNRFMFSNSSTDTFLCISKMLKNYPFDITKLYKELYKRPFCEIQLFGHMISNMKISDYGVGYVKIGSETLTKFNLDTASSGNLINDFNNIEELLVWLSATEDIKNSCIRVSIRSNGPVINKVAEKYNGGGHKLACGARLSSFEDVDLLVKDLDHVCKKYIESSDVDENY